MNAETLLEKAKTLGVKIIVAESLTGGLLSAELVSVPGASQSFLGSVVAYNSSLKHELLGVSEELLQRAGAVNTDVALQMAIGAREIATASEVADARNILAIATTGVAGPDTQDGAPVGKVFVAVTFSDFEQVAEFQFEGDRAAIRAQAVNAAIAAGVGALS